MHSIFALVPLNAHTRCRKLLRSTEHLAATNAQKPDHKDILDVSYTNLSTQTSATVKRNYSAAAAEASATPSTPHPPPANPSLDPGRPVRPPPHPRRVQYLRPMTGRHAVTPVPTVEDGMRHDVHRGRRVRGRRGGHGAVEVPAVGLGREAAAAVGQATWGGAGGLCAGVVAD